MDYTIKKKANQQNMQNNGGQTALGVLPQDANNNVWSRPTTGYQTNNGQYQSAYSSMIDSLVNKAINREAFNYDPATDPAYQSYARQYLRLGDEAGRDTLADVASNTGGLASSYAVTASQQARNAYNQALTDKIPELMQVAYDRYRNEYNDALAGIGTLQGLDDSLYNRFSTDRSYNRGVYESDRDFNESVRQYNQNYDLDKNSAEFERMLNTWATMGYANSTVAKYFGVPEGTRTDDSQYRWAQYALSQAKSGGSSGGSGGRRSSGSGSGGNGNSTQSMANSIVAHTENSVTNSVASMIGGTDNAKQYLARLGQYLAQGGTTSDRQSLAIKQVQNDKSLSAMEKLWILQQLSK